MEFTKQLMKDKSDLIKEKPTLESLLSFQCELTQNMEVTSIDFNKQNPDLFIAGYRNSKRCQNVISASKAKISESVSEKETTADKKGLICFWTVKNSEYPEKYIRTKSGVTAVKFCKMNPYLFGVGMVDGTIAIYDMRKNSET